MSKKDPDYIEVNYQNKRENKKSKVTNTDRASEEIRIEFNKSCTQISLNSMYLALRSLSVEQENMFMTSNFGDSLSSQLA